MPQSSALVIGDPYSSKSSEEFLKKFTELISSSVDNTFVLSGDKPADKGDITWHPYKLEIQNDFDDKAKQFLEYQFATCKKVVEYHSRLNYIVLRSPSYIFPTLLGEILGIETKLFVAQKPNIKFLPQIAMANMHIADQLIIESPGVLEHWGKEDLKGKSEVGSVYVDLSRFRKKKNISDRGYDIGYLGTLNKRKNVHKLIDSVREISENNPSFKTVIGGAGELSDSVETLSEEYANVEYKGFVTDDDLCDFYNSCKLFVLPSSSEGLPNVLLEAMACGTPPLGTSISAISDVIDHRNNGFLIDKNRVDDLSTVIPTCLDTPYMETISDTCRSYIEERYSKDNALRRYNTIF
ncbi:glycosyltransferase family 4 protein [Halobacterium sp. MBLA0001]|uniref:glycosyltransferase family 4 protein n=1 Tax=Halobacterium sp. MBLA0001 TaxID=3413511 RepID=UPI003C70A0B0